MSPTQTHLVLCLVLHCALDVVCVGLQLVLGVNTGLDGLVLLSKLLGFLQCLNEGLAEAGNKQSKHMCLIKVRVNTDLDCLVLLSKLLSFLGGAKGTQAQHNQHSFNVVVTTSAGNQTSQQCKKQHLGLHLFAASHAGHNCCQPMSGTPT